MLTEIKRLSDKATLEVAAPDWLRSIVGDEGLTSFGRIVEIELNERTDGHKEPTPKPLSDRVTDDWLKLVADQVDLRRLEISGTAVTSAGLEQIGKLPQLRFMMLTGGTRITAAGRERLQTLLPKVEFAP